MVADPVILALEEQMICYQRLAKLAALQHEQVQQNQIESLLEVLGRRQDLLEQVARLEQTIAPARRQWSQYVGGLTGPGRWRAETLLAQTRKLLEQITTADQGDALVLQQRKL